MIALRMRPYIETSSGFIIDRRELGGPRSQRGVRKISLEVFFRTDVIDGHSSQLPRIEPQLDFDPSLSATGKRLAAAWD
jgi:hypothetical protein